MKDDKAIYRLVYVSRSALSGPAADMEGEVFRILDHSRHNNARDGITGALLFSEDCFAQVLEGELSSVNGVFERIQIDPRHCETVVLECGPVSGREFGDWSMAYAGRVEAETARYTALTAPGAAAAGVSQVLGLLRGVMTRATAA